MLPSISIPEEENNPLIASASLPESQDGLAHLVFCITKRLRLGLLPSTLFGQV